MPSMARARDIYQRADLLSALEARDNAYWARSTEDLEARLYELVARGPGDGARFPWEVPGRCGTGINACG